MKQLFLINKDTYFDNASTTKKLKSVVDSVSNYYSGMCENVHRSFSKTTFLYENIRKKTALFISANPAEVIFTSGTTSSINLVASNFLWKKGDEILLHNKNHNSNILPWQIAANKHKLKVKFFSNMKQLLTLLSYKTKLVSLTHVCNVDGSILDAKKALNKIKSINKNTFVFLDGAQSISHFAVDVKTIGCDFFCFSGHKMYGPEGIGVLFINNRCRKFLPNLHVGGGVVECLENKKLKLCGYPYRYEAGTPNIAGVIGLDKCLDFFNSNYQKISSVEQMLTSHAISILGNIKDLFFLNPLVKTPIISFYIKDKSNEDIQMLSRSKGYVIRAGHCCAHYYLHSINMQSILRVSLAPYNDLAEIENFANFLNTVL